MARAAKHIQGLKGLDQELHRLRRHARKLEKELDNSLSFLENNYSKMMTGSLFPFLRERGGIAGSILELILRNQRFREKLGELAEQVFGKATEGLEFLIDKMGSKKSSDVF
jgi:hypothetical protein